MNELTLHSFRRCPFAIRVRMTLEEKGLNYDLIEEDLSDPSEALLRIHPSGRVPVLVHGDRVIPESAVITEYIEELHPMPALMPPTAWGRAQVRLWTQECAEIFKPDLDAYKYDWPQLDPQIREVLVARIQLYLMKIDSALSTREFLLGPSLTLADIHLFPFLRQLSRVRQAEHSTLKWPSRANAWLQRILERPTFKRAMNKSGKV